ncbi:MAG: hypothetical protein EXS16_08830 [Gemmataceae bacterium]|nr:hypothetical protein [Gemmataceae bacterium]
MAPVPLPPPSPEPLPGCPPLPGPQPSPPPPPMGRNAQIKAASVAAVPSFATSSSDPGVAPLNEIR